MLTFWKYDLEFILPPLPDGPLDCRNPTTPSPAVQASVHAFAMGAEGVALPPEVTAETKSTCTTARDA